MATFKQGLKELIPQLSSDVAEERERGSYWAVRYFVDANMTEREVADVLLPTLLETARRDPAKRFLIATAAQALVYAEGFEQALTCLNELLTYPKAEQAISQYKPRWDVTAAPITAEQERALNLHYRYLCLLATGDVNEASRILPEVEASSQCLPGSFRFAGVEDYGTPSEYLRFARITACRALRIRADGRDVDARRRVLKAQKPNAKEAQRLLDVARSLIEPVIPELRPLLPRYTQVQPGTLTTLPEAQRKKLQLFWGQGFAEAGMVAMAQGREAEGREMLGIARSVYLVNWYGPPPEYKKAMEEWAILAVPLPTE